MKRIIKYIVVHCTATQPEATVEALRKYWKEVKGWGEVPGYHYLVKRNGEIESLLRESEVSYGAYGHNAVCVHIAYIGGIDKEGKPCDNRSLRQKDALYNKLVELSVKYPGAEILGHRDFPGVTKACPSFDVKSWIRDYRNTLKSAA